MAAGPVGIQTITRHPANWGVALWAGAHLFPNGDLASVLFFGGLLALAILGSLHIDHRRSRSHPEQWAGFARQTSFVPLAAVIRGRCRLDLPGIGWRSLVGLAAFGLALWGHAWMMGASPLP